MLTTTCDRVISHCFKGQNSTERLRWLLATRMAERFDYHLKFKSSSYKHMRHIWNNFYLKKLFFSWIRIQKRSVASVFQESCENYFIKEVMKLHGLCCSQDLEHHSNDCWVKLQVTGQKHNWKDREIIG